MASVTSFVFVLAFLVAPAQAGAQSDAVVVEALRKPVHKSYEKMVAGMDLFEKRHHLAPQAELRWKLLPRKRDTAMSGIELEIAADNFGLPLEIAPDGTFTVARSAEGLKEKARVMPNRREGSMTWRADVRTPGLPPNVRRLGDLRLECEVGMEAGTISNYPASFFGFFDIRREGPRYCRKTEPRYLFFAERPVWGVTLVHGARREAISVDRLYISATRNKDWRKSLQHCDCEVLVDRAYFVPLGDESWPDDTLVVLEGMDAPAGTDYLHFGASTKKDVLAAFGEMAQVGFASGWQVWSYRQDEGAELVLLFDPSGRLANTRIR